MAEQLDVQRDCDGVFTLNDLTNEMAHVAAVK